MKIQAINEASTWTWEEGTGWSEGSSESTWLKVYRSSGEPLKDIFKQDVFVGYHSFMISSNSLQGRIFNSSLHLAGAVRLYTKCGNHLIKSEMHQAKTRNIVDQINWVLNAY